MTKADVRLNRLFDKIAFKLPWTAKFLTWLRSPSNAIVRVPVAFLMILGGIFSFLPGLGLWMLPLGLLFLAIDIIQLREPVTKYAVLGQRTVVNWIRRFKK